MADAAALAGGATLAGAATTLAASQLWAGPKVNGIDGPGSVSPDGRYFSFADWDSGNLAIHDFTTGENRLVTSGGTYETDGGYNYVENSRWSPDGKQLAYTRYDYHNYDVWLTDVEGLDSRSLYSNDDVARLLGIRSSTVRNHLFQARRVLQQALRARYPEYLRGQREES